MKPRQPLLGGRCPPERVKSSNKRIGDRKIQVRLADKRTFFARALSRAREESHGASADACIQLRSNGLLPACGESRDTERRARSAPAKAREESHGASADACIQLRCSGLLPACGESRDTERRARSAPGIEKSIHENKLQQRRGKTLWKNIYLPRNL